MRWSQLLSGAPFRTAERTTVIAPMISRRRISRWPLFEIFPRTCLPPVDCCRGTLLPGDKPEPGGEIASSFEDIHRRREGLDRQRRDGANPRHRLQTPCRFRACRFLSRRLLEFGDGFRQPFDPIKKDTRQFRDEKRKRCCLILDRLFKNFHIRRPLRSHDAVLRQMTAQRVYQLRALPDQEIPRPEQHAARLLFLGLNRDKAHRRPT